MFYLNLYEVKKETKKYIELRKTWVHNAHTITTEEEEEKKIQQQQYTLISYSHYFIYIK